jgi:hypothetical protein
LLCAHLGGCGWGCWYLNGGLRPVCW